eukprot:CAMPEP_0184858526 /NCGR_PEP_ID=MMETSP0580-20130426/3609_1 /TAXON_ID=1118495 /ORGANISM="Dactyliosolen fragilissimus" /LENGTH=663 /DNA_ID=CAMNT_0027354707 /DNA_START=12 /DNA_END=2003 /DNA_ORIENTATION=-
MGNSVSAKQESLDALRSQVTKLGDRLPYGDEEIIRLGRAYTYIRHIRLSQDRENVKTSEGAKEDDGETSFLCDWGTYGHTLPTPDYSSPDYTYSHLLQIDNSNLFDHDDLDKRNHNVLKTRAIRSALMREIEEYILPPGFGQRLEREIFLMRDDSSFYNPGESSSQIDVSKSPTSALDQLRLEKFLDGAAECARRGTRRSLTAVFSCCTPMKSNSETHDDKSVKAYDLIRLSYGLALASALLKESSINQVKAAHQNVQEDNKEDEMNDSHDFVTNSNNFTSSPSASMVDTRPFYPRDLGTALTQSLLDYHAAQLSSEGTFVDSKNDAVILSSFLAWAETTTPCLGSCLETFVHYLFFPDKPYPPSRSGMFLPDLKGQHSAFFQDSTVSTRKSDGTEDKIIQGDRNSPLLFTLACLSPSLGGTWYRIFTTDTDGISFNRLQNALLGYGGPTLLIIREAQNGGIFGAFTSSAWKEHKDFYGNSDCFLFRLMPSTAVYRPRGAGSNYMYCNSESRSRGYDGLAHGIGFGGTTLKPRFFISENLDGCMVANADLTFEPGSLLPDIEEEGHLGSTMTSSRKYFDLESLEVWGVGGESTVSNAIGAREKQREIVAANIRKARKVDKAQFLDDFKSGLIESKAFQHREQMRGRGDCHVDDNDPKNYVYEK